MIGVILLQKGEDVSAGSGGGAYNPGTSGRGSKNILTRVTACLAACFFVTCLVLAILVRQESSLSSKAEKEKEAPMTLTKPKAL